MKKYLHGRRHIHARKSVGIGRIKKANKKFSHGLVSFDKAMRVFSSGEWIKPLIVSIEGLSKIVIENNLVKEAERPNDKVVVMLAHDYGVQQEHE